MTEFSATNTNDDREPEREERKQPASLRRLIKWFAITLAVLIVISSMLLIAFQMAVSRVPEYRVQLQDWLSGKTKVAIEFSDLSARLRWYGPELTVEDVTVRSPDRTRVLATARGGSIGLDVWRSIGNARLTAGQFVLESPQLGLIRTRDGRIQIAGQSALADGPKPFAIDDLPVGHFQVRDALVNFHDEATGRGPWTLSGVDFALDRQPTQVELKGQASLPTALGQKVDFNARAAGPLEQPERVVSTLTVEGQALDLTGWADVLPDRWPAPESGRGSMRVTAAFLGSALQSLNVKADFADVTSSPPAWTIPLPAAEPLRIGSRSTAQPKRSAQISAKQPTTAPNAAQELAEVAVDVPRVASPADDVMLSYKRVNIDGRIARTKDGWQAQLDALDLDAADESNVSADWSSRGIEMQWSTPLEGAVNISGKADVVVLQSATPLLAYLPETERLAHLRALAVRGTLRDIEFSAQRDGAASLLRYSVRAGADQIGFNPVLRSPGFTGLSGMLEASETAGEFRLDTGPVRVTLPRMFRWPLEAQSLRGALTWRDEGDAWTVGTEQLVFDSVDGKGEARIAIRLPRDGSSPHMVLAAQAREMNAAATPKYLPANNLTPAALAWLDRAFVSGRVPRGELKFEGPLRSFPFRDGKGEFLVRGRVEDLTFDYQRGWLPATQLTGDVEFRNEGMQANRMTARLGDVIVTDASGRFGDFKQGDLTIRAAATGDLSAALAFLQASPVSAALGDTFKKIRGSGATKSTVELFIPIAHIDERRVTVTTELADSKVLLEGFDAPVTALNGSITVRQTLPVEANLKGEFLGGPLTVSLTPDGPDNSAAKLVAHGHATVERLATFAPEVAGLAGATDWQLTTRLTTDMKQRPQLYVVESQLQGLKIGMPYPIGKAADEQRALRVELEQGERRLLTRAALGNVRALLRVQESRGAWSFDRGSVRADGIAAALPDHQGLRVEGAIDRLRLDDWFALRDARPATTTAGNGAAAKLSDFLHAANLRVGTLQLFGYEWPDVRGVMQATPQGWRLDVAGENVEGQVVVPEDFAGPRPLSVNLERLILTRSNDRGGNSDSDKPVARDPRTWPSLNIHVGDMHVENHPIGGVDLVTTRVPEGLRIETLSLAQDAVQVEARGDWLFGPAGERSSLVARITSTDVRATLRALNYTEFLEAKRAEVSAQLSWPGGFNGNLIKRASGAITVSADGGRLLTLQPGAGRVLGLFSVAALPRRLSLDFSDLTEKGLSFDTIHGDFELREGNAFTSNLLLRGPAAEIGIAGRTGLAAQDYEQTAVVTGNLGASLPVAGALAGGPVVGAAVLLFSQVFKEPLKGIARGYYRISGTWDEPVVERVDAAEAKEGTASQ